MGQVQRYLGSEAGVVGREHRVLGWELDMCHIPRHQDVDSREGGSRHWRRRFDNTGQYLYQ